MIWGVTSRFATKLCPRGWGHFVGFWWPKFQNSHISLWWGGTLYIDPMHNSQPQAVLAPCLHHWEPVPQSHLCWHPHQSWCPTVWWTLSQTLKCTHKQKEIEREHERQHDGAYQERKKGIGERYRERQRRERGREKNEYILFENQREAHESNYSSCKEFCTAYLSSISATQVFPRVSSMSFLTTRSSFS